MGVSDEGFSEKARGAVEEKPRRVQTRVTLTIFGSEGAAYHTVQQMERWLRVELGDRVESVAVDWVADA